MMALTRRIVEVTVKLATNSRTNQPNTFSESGTDTVTLRGSRTSVRIQHSGAPAGSTAQIDVFGLTPSQMNQFSTLGLVFNIVPINTILISAGDAASGLSLVFTGTIQSGYGDYDSAPDVPFKFMAKAGLAGAVTPSAASSFTGSTNVATIMEGFAKKLKIGFENNGVDVKLASPYFSGNLWTQLRACAEHAHINAEIVDGGSKLAIWPKGGSRATKSIPLIAPLPDGQMIGYPAFTQQGIIVRTVFDPKIQFGGLVKVRTPFLDNLLAAQRRINQTFKLPADSVWAVNKLDLALDSLVPKGQWMSTVYAYNPNYPKPIPPQGGP